MVSYLSVKSLLWGTDELDEPAAFRLTLGFLKQWTTPPELCCPVIIFHVNECRGNSSQDVSQVLRPWWCQNVPQSEHWNSFVFRLHTLHHSHNCRRKPRGICKRFLSLRLKRDLIFLVSQITTKIKLCRVKLFSLFINVENGILIVIRLLSSNR